MTSFTVTAPAGFGEVHPGTDLAARVLAVAQPAGGDVVVVTSKVVSKAEGRTRRASREEVLPEVTARVVARRGPTTIVRTRQGLVMAAGGVDASNVEAGTVVLLPEDPDRSARELRRRLGAAGVNVAVVVSDTSGRAWRVGQTDIAVGCAGLAPLEDHAGRVDGYGNRLEVTAPALADELAGAGDLAKGKLSGRPVAIVRGLGALVLPPGEHGPGAAALVRPEDGDLFGYGARDAVAHAVLADEDGRGFGAPAPAAAVGHALALALGDVGGDRRLAVVQGSVEVSLEGLDERSVGRVEARGEVLGRAHGREPVGTGSRGRVRLRPRQP